MRQSRAWCFAKSHQLLASPRGTAHLTALSVCLSVQVQMQPQWQMQDCSNDDGKVRNTVALEGQKYCRGFLFYFFSSPSRSKAAVVSLEIGIAALVSSR